MAGRGPAPKPPELRQRRNIRTTGRTLPTEEQAASQEVPPLPAREDEKPWHPKVVEWWETAWRSPMASEWLAADLRGGLFLLADLWQIRWTATSSSALIEVAKEIRLQEARFGLTPMDRKRLEWEIDKREDAAPVAEDKRQAVGAPDPRKDPRSVLKLG